jgi:hypothetical protein
MRSYYMMQTYVNQELDFPISHSEVVRRNYSLSRVLTINGRDEHLLLGIVLLK